jgi:hypothetical protein
MRIAAAIALLCACSCRPVPPPVVVPDAGCEAACATLERLQLPGAEGSAGPDRVAGTADDVPCPQACAEFEAEGFDMHTACVAWARTSAEVDACAD